MPNHAPLLEEGACKTGNAKALLEQAIELTGAHLNSVAKNVSQKQNIYNKKHIFLNLIGLY